MAGRFGDVAVLSTPLATPAGTATRRGRSIRRHGRSDARPSSCASRSGSGANRSRIDRLRHDDAGLSRLDSNGDIAVLVEPCEPSVDLDDLAETLVLSGRADLVAFEADGQVA